MYKLAIFVSAKTGVGTVKNAIWRLKDLHLARPPISNYTCINLIDISEFTWILVCRDPIIRLVSSYSMPEVGPDVTFHDFVHNFESYTHIHQALQATGKPLEFFDMYPDRKFDHVVQTEQLGGFLDLLQVITGAVKHYGIPVDSQHVRDKTETTGNFSMVSKSELEKTRYPPWFCMYDNAILEVAMSKTASDREFFAKFGVTWETHNLEAQQLKQQTTCSQSRSPQTTQQEWCRLKHQLTTN